MNNSRREFLKTSFVAGAAIGMSTSSTGDVQAAGRNPSKGPPITIAGYKYDRVEALVDGRISDRRF